MHIDRIITVDINQCNIYSTGHHIYKILLYEAIMEYLRNRLV